VWCVTIYRYVNTPKSFISFRHVFAFSPQAPRDVVCVCVCVCMYIYLYVCTNVNLSETHGLYDRTTHLLFWFLFYQGHPIRIQKLLSHRSDRCHRVIFKSFALWFFFFVLLLLLFPRRVPLHTRSSVLAIVLFIVIIIITIIIIIIITHWVRVRRPSLYVLYNRTWNYMAVHFIVYTYIYYNIVRK